MADETIRLGLDLGDSSAKAKDLASSIASTGKAAKDAAAGYDVLGTSYEIVSAGYDEAVDRAVRAAVERTAAEKAVRRALDESTTAQKSATVATDRAATSSRSVNQSLLNTSRGIQDFAAGWKSNGVQGAFVGISNNMESLAALVAKTPEKVLALSVAFNVLGAAMPFIADGLAAVWREFKKLGSNEQIGGITQLEKALAGVKGQVDAIKEADVWNFESIQKYNGLLQSQAAIEKEIAERKKHQTDYEKFMASLSPEGKASLDDVSKGFNEVFAGRGKELQGELIKGLEAEAEETRKTLREQREQAQAILRNPYKLAADYRKARERIAAIDRKVADVGRDINSRVVQILSDAAGGDTADARKNALADIARLGGDGVKADVDRVLSTDWTGRYGDSPEQRKKKDDDVKAAAEKAADAKAKRYAKYRDEMAAASKSTPEEERLSEALAAIDARGVRMTDAEKLKAAGIAVDAAVKNRRLSGRRAVDMGIRAVGEDRAKAKDAADAADDEREIDRATGGRLSYDQIQGATRRMRQLVGQGFNPMAAMEAAVNELVQTQGEFINKVVSINSGMNALAGQARFQKQQVRAIKQMESSYLSRGG